MGADDDGDLQGLAPRLDPLLERPEVPAAVEARPQAVPALDLKAVKGAVAHAGVRVLGHDDSRREVGPRVLVEVCDERQPGKIHVLSRLNGIEDRPGLQHFRGDRVPVPPDPGV